MKPGDIGYDDGPVVAHAKDCDALVAPDSGRVGVNCARMMFDATVGPGNVPMGYEAARRKQLAELRAEVGNVNPRPPGGTHSKWTIAQLARIRGAMWTQRLNLPYGPRPGQDSNINAMDYYEKYGPDDRKRMIEKTLEGGYTHAVTGPFYDEGGYHGRWPNQTSLDQRVWEAYLDCMEEWRDANIIPVHFMSPDNWSLGDCKSLLNPLYLQPRAQELLPIKVPHGWEPAKYGTSSRTWALWGDWAAEVSAPDTLILAHSEQDTDALVGGDARYDDSKDGASNGVHWQYVAPHFHGWLIQLGGYVAAQGDPRLIAEWRVNLAAYISDMKSRFNGRGDWPRGSRFGPDVPLKVYLGEDASYFFFNNSTTTEAEVREFGDIAIAHGAAGYLDGGSVDVP